RRVAVRALRRPAHLVDLAGGDLVAIPFLDHGLGAVAGAVDDLDPDVALALARDLESVAGALFAREAHDARGHAAAAQAHPLRLLRCGALSPFGGAAGGGGRLDGALGVRGLRGGLLRERRAGERSGAAERPDQGGGSERREPYGGQRLHL